MDTITILCSTDRHFAPYCGIMLTSLFANNQDEQLVVYLLIDDSVAKDDTDKYLQLSRQYRQTLHIIHVDPSRFDRYPVYNPQWTNAIYYRLMVTELLPDSIDKIIYLDADIIVTRSIREMWQIDVSDVALGVVEDIWAPNPQVYERLGLPYDRQYFNTGAMVINLRYWREQNLAEQFMCYIRDNFDRLWFNDQDTLNGVLYNCKRILPVTYNFQIPLLRRSLFDPMTEEQKHDILHTTSPLIMHYSGPTKPWMILYYKMPYLDLWRQYRDMSLWRSTPNRLPKSKLLSWLVKRYILWPLNLYFKQEYIRIS